MLSRVLLAIDDVELRQALRAQLAQPDILLENVRISRRAWDRLTHSAGDAFVISESLVPRPESQSVRFLRMLPDSPSVIVVTDAADPEEHARLMASGCDAVIYSGVSLSTFRNVVLNVLSRRADVVVRTAESGRDMTQARLTDFVSQSPSMQTFMHVVQRVVPSDVPLLLMGETGVGKERLARAIHAEGPRAAGPFIAVNCGALPESLLESELFGHEKGAFTGAARSRRGWFELAHRGTIFLDEIGEMPYHLQVKLLRVLQDHQVQAIGSEKTITVDVRVMAASNRDLEQEVEARNFRRDLYYRLSVVTLTIPPLRERRDDIPILIESYLDYLQPRIGCQVEGIDPRATEALVSYDWPGNVRELINMIERALLLSDGRLITLADLPEVLGGRPRPGAPRMGAAPQRPVDVPEEWMRRPWSEVRRRTLDGVERSYFAELLRQTGGRVGETAQRAGMSPRSLYDKMQRLGLTKEEFRL